MSTPPPRLFDARRLRDKKTRAARKFHESAFLHARAAGDLAERLEAIPRRFSRTLLLGASKLMREAIAARPALAARLDATVAAETAAPMLADGDGVIIELDHLAFAPASFDLILSPLSLHWANDAPGALIQLRHALVPDGLLLASLFGAETLQELRLCLLEAELAQSNGAARRIAPFIDVHSGAALLQRAGFTLPAADRDVLTVRYATPARLLADLRAMGETSALTQQQALSRATLGDAMARYTRSYADADGRVRATFEIVTLTGWAPHASQPKPRRRGAAKTRLAAALGVEELSTGEKAGAQAPAKSAWTEK